MDSIALNLKIIIIDDILPQATHLKRRLEKNHNDFEIFIETDPYKALDIIAAPENAYNPFDLAIIDYFMPIMNGDKLGEKIKSIDPNIAIAIITLDDSEEVALEIGSSDLKIAGFLVKSRPFSDIESFLNLVLSDKKQLLKSEKSLMKKRMSLYLGDSDKQK